MRFRLRTLLIVLALGPPAIACIWLRYRHAEERAADREAANLIELERATMFLTAEQVRDKNLEYRKKTGRWPAAAVQQHLIGQDQANALFSTAVSVLLAFGWMLIVFGIWCSLPARWRSDPWQDALAENPK